MRFHAAKLLQEAAKKSQQAGYEAGTKNQT